MIVNAPFRLPPDFLDRFGYRGHARLVALYWEASGDEACYQDDVSFACGCCDNGLFLDFIRQPQVKGWLDAHGLHLGNSDEPARHWLIADALHGDLYTALRREALRIVRTQQLPKTEIGENGNDRR
jgi:hypothetical protein